MLTLVTLGGLEQSNRRVDAQAPGAEGVAEVAEDESGELWPECVPTAPVGSAKRLSPPHTVRLVHSMSTSTFSTGLRESEIGARLKVMD